MLRSTLWLATCLSLASAHMQLTFPIPLASTFDPLVTNPDYSMTTPLATDGSNFPCKGYLSRSDAHVTASFSAGQQANFTLAGSATHGGGSCQISLSYDGGKTFKVINTVLGGCPLQNKYDFQVPAGLPAGKNVVFSWSWFNKVGNREMYQNCALVNIIGTGSSSFLFSLPDMQVANVGNGCSTIESIEVIPKNPGSYLQYGGSYAAGQSAVTGLNGAGLTGTCGTAAVAAVPVPVQSTTAASSTILGTTAVGRAGFKATSIAENVQTTSVKTTAAAATTSSAAAASSGQSCSNGAIVCTGTGYTWSLCSSGSLVAMGAVAPGTICRSGQMVADSGSAATVVPGNVAKTTSTSTSTSTKSTTTPTSACLNKREAYETCSMFSIKCLSPYTYSLCQGDDWSDGRALSSEELCVDDRVIHVASLQSDAQVALKKQTHCSGTGVTCSEDGMSYHVCDGSSALPVPSGTKCVESNSGGGFVSWQSV